MLYEQMDLASNETSLLERLNSSQSEIILPNQFILAPFSLYYPKVQFFEIRVF